MKTICVEASKKYDVIIDRGILSNAGELSVIAETKLPTGEYSAHADNFAEVRFLSKSDFDLKGKLVKVRPVSHKDGIIYAEEIVCL